MPRVAAIDLDSTSIDLARARCGDLRIDYPLGDFLTHSFEPGSFDVGCSVAALHHMDAERALRRMRELLRPGATRSPGPGRARDSAGPHRTHPDGCC